jgi:type II secretory pathway pseudopilin PulG
MPTTPLTATVPPARPGSRRRFAGSETGFTLIEVLVSALLVILIASAAAGTLIVTGHVSGDQRLRSESDSLASQDQERLRGLSDEQLNNFTESRPVTLNGTTFTVASASTFLDTAGASGCTTTAAAFYKISSSVTWTENYSHVTPVTEESILSRPVTGDLLTQVKDQNGQGVSGVNVTATSASTQTSPAGASTQTSTTSSNGCVLFAGLVPGSYTVSMADSNYVDPNGVPSPLAASATVTTSSPTSTTGNPFYLGLAGSITGTFTTAVAAASGEADTISWVGSGGASGGPSGMSGGFRFTPLGAISSSITTLPLFPFNGGTSGYTNNYAVWAGRCAQQQPPAAYDHFTVGSSGTLNQAQNIQEPLLDLAVDYPNATTPVKPSHVKLTFQSTAGTSCGPNSWTPTLAGGATLPANGWLANPGQPFASTATTGTTASGASTSSSPQAGSLTVCVDYRDPGNGRTYKNATTINNTNFSSTPSATLITITQATQASC